jgi:hypothetical protein
MNYFKLLHGLDILHKSLNYKNLKMAIIDNISFYLTSYINILSILSSLEHILINKNYFRIIEKGTVK